MNIGKPYLSDGRPIGQFKFENKPFVRRRRRDWGQFLGCSLFIAFFLFVFGIIIAYWGTIIYVAQHFIRKYW